MLLGISALFTVAASAQSKQTLTGTVSDAMCDAHHMIKGATPAQCTRKCVKQGSDFALVSKEKVYTLKGDKAQFDKVAGQNVTVKGSLPCRYPVAAGLFVRWGFDLPMSVGAIAMSLSTIIVAANAQLLRRLKLQPVAT